MNCTSCPLVDRRNWKSPLLQEFCRRIEIVPPPARSNLNRAFETLFSPLPDMARRLNSPDLAIKFDALVESEDYDLIQIEGIEMANSWMTEVANWKAVSGTPPLSPATDLQAPNPRLQSTSTKIQAPIWLFDDHNAEYVLQKSAFESDRRRFDRMHGALYSFIQWHKLARFERDVCLKAGHVAAVSESDAKALTALDSRINPVVIPNGVDLVHYIPSEEVCAKPLAEFSVVFTGKMDFRPNVDAAVWFAKEILPALRRIVPLAHVSFVGQQPNAAVLALANRPGVEVTGWVADTRPYIADAAVYAVPLRMGGGTRLEGTGSNGYGQGDCEHYTRRGGHSMQARARFHSRGPRGGFCTSPWQLDMGPGPEERTGGECPENSRKRVRLAQDCA